MAAESEPPTFENRPPTPLTVQAPLAPIDPLADGVCRLTLNRPDALNALNRDLTVALEQALERVAAMTDVRVLLVAGRGRAFCAGNDIREMDTFTGEDAETLAARHAALMDRFATLPQVTLAAIDGHALGGGLMLAVAQDLRIASDRARFGLPEVTLGFNPSYGIARLIDVLGGAHARDLLLTGRTIDAAEAATMGLATRVVPPKDLDQALDALVHQVTAKGPIALRFAKEAVLKGNDLSLDQGIRLEQDLYVLLQTTHDRQAGIRAFLEKRKPVFHGE